MSLSRVCSRRTYPSRDGPTAGRPGADLYGTGWGTADELVMPLSPRYCLIMLLDAPAKAEQVHRVGRLKGPEIAKGVNVTIAAGASRWIVHHPESAPLKDVV